MGVAGVRVEEVDGAFAHDAAQGARAEEIPFSAQGRGNAVYRAAPVCISKERAVRASRDGDLVSAPHQALDEPTRLLFAAPPAALFVNVQHVHGAAPSPPCNAMARR